VETIMIDILMATYNGEKYIRQQLNSILQQDYDNWNLIIRDDCSSDNTVQIIEEYQSKFPQKIKLIHAEAPSGSAQNNFFALLPYSQSEYMMFADQDDVWISNKISLTLSKMEQMEQLYGNSIPLLVYTDLAIVDEKLTVINPSRYKMHDINPERNQLNHLIVQGIVYGCTLMANRELLNLIKDKPSVDVMHDTWLSLLAAAFGVIGFVNKPTVWYRRHGKNSTSLCSEGYFHWLLFQLSNIKKIRKKHKAYYNQANELLVRYYSILTNQQKVILNEYASLVESHPIKKAIILKKYDLYREGILPKIAQILL